MTPLERRLILQLLHDRRPKRCLEWGIGGSTVEFSQADGIEEWIGIEHNRDWIDRVCPCVSSHVRLHHAPVATAELLYASPSLIQGYVHHPATAGVFDLVFIDGDYRWQCLKRASEILSAEGICLVHDSARKDMHAHFHHFQRHLILTPGELNANNSWHQGLTILWNRLDLQFDDLLARSAFVDLES